MPKTKGFAPEAILARSHPELPKPDLELFIAPVMGTDHVLLHVRRIRGSGPVTDVWVDRGNVLRMVRASARIMGRVLRAYFRLARTGTKLSRLEILQRARAQVRAAKRAVTRSANVTRRGS